MDKSKNSKNYNPKLSSSICGRIFYCWLVPFFFTGDKNDIESSDLYDVLPEHQSEQLANSLEKFWNVEVAEAKKSNKSPSLLRAIINNYGSTFAKFGFYAAYQEVIAKVSQPLLVAVVISYFDENSIVSRTEAFAYVFGVVACTASYLLAQNLLQRNMRNMGSCLRIACSSLIFRKILRLPYSSTQQMSGGKIINLLSNDVTKFEKTLIYVHFLWVVPIQITLIGFIMWFRVGIAALAGIATLISLSIPTQVLCGKMITYLQRKIASWADERILLMGEIINGIRVIKMYTWEGPFENLVSMLRNSELNAVAKTFYIRSILQSLYAFVHRSSLFVSIVVCIYQSNNLSAATLFTLVQYFNILHLSINVFFLKAISFNAVTITSIKRIQDFLLYKELETDFMLSELVEDKEMISIKDVNGSWTEDPSVLCLKNINISVNPRKLCAISGPVGAGKSSLLKLLLREIIPIKGQVKVRGNISFASQEPWLFSGSIRGNILFGTPYCAEKYQRVTKACALYDDFVQLPNGDKTLVGDNGANLSGGQRARVNLARAIYRDADIYLLDDPLSAVDGKVGKRIFEMCIKDLLKDKTCLLVTHQVQYLKDADKIILLSQGHVQFQGSFPNLQNDKKLLKSVLSQDNRDVTIEDEEVNLSRLSLYSNFEKEIESSETSKLLDKEASVLKSIEDLVEIEELKAKKSIPYSLYVKYFKSGSSYCFITIVLAFFIVTQVLCSGSDYWIAYWVQSVEDEKFSDKSVGLKMLGLFLMSIIWVSIVRLLLFSKLCVNASKHIHRKMVSCLLGATINFFDTNNSGRVLNRFSKDLGVIDEMLPELLFEAYDSTFIILGVLIQVIIIDWKLIFPTAVLALVISKIKATALSVVQNLRRLEGNAKSPVLTHTKSSLVGVVTVRSCNAQSMVCQQFDVLQDSHTSAYSMTDDCLMSYSLFIDMSTVGYLSVVSFSFVIFENSNTPSAMIGLAIVQILSLSGALQKTLRVFAEISMQMVAVERLFQYTELEQEHSFESVGVKAPNWWPDKGKITFDKVNLRYSDSDEPVLKQLEFLIEPGSKVGIVGRTGAGKSSLITALFRLARVQGSLTIDKIDIKKVGLAELRKKISILPQHPTLFSISLRENLDPYKKTDDHSLWSALEDVEMKKVFDSLDDKLNFNNMSTGQRQLLCLARVILNKNKVIVFDEATANIDDNTDALIQKTIRSKFKDCTVLTIAHRLNTIMDSDKIIVMDGGRVVEYDHPHVLLRQKNGHFSKMVRTVGDKTSQFLQKIAEENYKIRLEKQKLTEKDLKED